MMSGKLGLWLTLTLLFLQGSSSCFKNCKKREVAITHNQDYLNELENQTPTVPENQRIKNLDEPPTDLTNQQPTELENQIIMIPNERRIETAFQKNRWDQLIVLLFVVVGDNQQNLPPYIVRLILTYVYEPFVPVTMTLPHHKGTGNMWENEISHDGQLLLSTDCFSIRSPYVHLTDLFTGIRVRTFTAPNKAMIRSCALARSHLFVVGGTETNKIHLWNTNSEDLITTLSGHRDTVHDLRVFLNDTRIVSGSSDNTVRIWSIEHTPGICLHVLEGHTMRVISCFVSADDTQIFSVSDDETVRVWDSHTFEHIQTRPCYNCKAACVISDDNEFYATARPKDGRAIKLWDIYFGGYQKTINMLDKGYMRIFYYSKNRLVLGNEHYVTVVNLETNKEMYSKKFAVDPYAYVQGTIDHKHLIIIGKDTHVTWMKVYNFETGDLIE